MGSDTATYFSIRVINIKTGASSGLSYNRRRYQAVIENVLTVDKSGATVALVFHTMKH